MARAPHLVATSFLLPCLLLACPAPLPPSVDLTLAHGQRALAVVDLAVADRQPGEQQHIDVRAAYLGQPGRVVPRGSLVVRARAEDPETSRSQNPAIDPALNRWVLVTVQQSPIPGQVGLQGWVFVSDLQPLTAEQTPPKDATDAGLATGLLIDHAALCAPAALGDACPFGVGPQMPMRTFGCDGEAVRVETWSPDGLYVAGYVPRAAFTADPCAAR